MQPGWVVYMSDNNVIYFSERSNIKQCSFLDDSLYEGVILNGYPKIAALKKMHPKLKSTNGAIIKKLNGCI